MKILVVCGSGLGSSFLVEMNVKKVLEELGIDAQVDHADLSSAKGHGADILVGTRDIAVQLEGKAKKVVSLNNVLDTEDMKNKIAQAIKELE